MQDLVAPRDESGELDRVLVGLGAPFVKKKVSMSPGVISASFAPSRARGSVAERIGVGQVSACSWMAATTFSWPWPIFVHISWLLKSRKRFPSGVQK